MYSYCTKIVSDSRIHMSSSNAIKLVCISRCLY